MLGVEIGLPESTSWAHSLNVQKLPFSFRFSFGGRALFLELEAPPGAAPPLGAAPPGAAPDPNHQQLGSVRSSGISLTGLKPQSSLTILSHSETKSDMLVCPCLSCLSFHRATACSRIVSIDVNHTLCVVEMAREEPTDGHLHVAVRLA